MRAEAVPASAMPTVTGSIARAAGPSCHSTKARPHTAPGDRRGFIAGSRAWAAAYFASAPPFRFRPSGFRPRGRHLCAGLVGPGGKAIGCS